MAMNYQNFASLGVNLNRQKYGPLDISNVFTSAADLKYYLTKGTFTEGVSEYWYKNANEKIVPYPYEGQVLATVIDGVVSVYALSLDAEGNFQTQEIGAKVEADGKTIKLNDGKLELVGLPTDTAGKTYVPSYVNGVLTWAEPDTSTAEGQAQEIEGLKTRAKALEATVNGVEASEGVEAVVGLVDKVAALEAVDNATQAELDAYKTEVANAIAAGIKEAKDYADAQDADTVYDDTALTGRVDVIERDYLKKSDETIYDDTGIVARIATIEADYLTEADKYDDTALVNRVATAEGKIADLEAAVEAIDYVDANELANAIKDFATDSELEAGLAAKADKEAFEALKGTVDAFLTGDGTEAALDSLKELVEYIKTHDDVEISGILSSIQAIEGKLAGVESTVAAYVTAAIDALKIGDYAKAADLAALASRVEALEAKPFDTYATKSEVEAVDGKFANYTTSEALATQMAAKADANSVVANDTFETFKTANTSAIATAKSEAIAAAAAAEEAKGYAVASEVENTYATKTALTEAVEGIENDLMDYAKAADTAAELAKKIETGSIAHSSESAAEGVTVDGTKLNIVVDAYTKQEVRDYVADVIEDMTGGESAADVLLALNNHIDTYEEKVGQLDAKDAAQDTAITKAQEDATKGINDAAKVAGDLATANLAIEANAREIGVAKGSIETVNNTLTEKITALEGKDTGFTTSITALETLTEGHTTTISAQGVAITALQTRDTELAALIQGNTDKFANYSTTEQVNKAIDDKIAAIPAVDFTGYATETYVDNAIAPISSAVELKANAADVYTKTVADETFVKEAEFESKVDARVNTLIDGANSEDTITNVTNLIAFVNDNAGDIAQLVTDVENNGKAIEANVTAIAANKAAHEKNASDIVAINELLTARELKESAEISIAAVEGEGATGVQLNIKEVNVNKLVQTTGDTLVLNGGSAV